MNKQSLRPNGLKKILVSGLVLAAAAIGAVGGSSLNAIQTSAQTSSAQSSDATTAQVVDRPQGNVDPSKGGHKGSNGQIEELLTGDTEQKVKAAALAAVPGGTIERVETDAEGSPYEAHMTKADGTRITVKVDSNFKVTSQDSGMH